MKCFHINNLIKHLKALEQKKEIIPKRTRWCKILEVKAEINQIENINSNNKQYEE